MKNYIRITGWFILAAHLALPPALLLAWRAETLAAESAGTPAPASPAVFTGGAQTVPARQAASTGTVQVSYFAPQTDRDPTMSPEDYQKIADAEERRRDLIERQRLDELKRLKAESPEYRIKLQGIVGNEALINGEHYRLGQTVKLKGVPGARIIGIGPDHVRFEYRQKGAARQFEKGM